MNSALPTLIRVLPLALIATLAACAEDDGAQESDLTSNTAVARTLAFEGYVYVEPGTSDSAILAIVHDQTQTMFGPLREAEIGVNKRELQGVDPASFQKTELTAIDTSVADDPGHPIVRVKYRYEDTAVVPKAMATRSAITLAVMNPEYASQTQRILQECTSNDSHAQEFASSIWYVFNPTLSRCQSAITAEQQAVDAENQKLADQTTEVSLAEVNRLYIPTTVKLGADVSNTKPAFPEYHRLFTGGVEAGKLVISMVNGFIDHERTGGPETDYGYDEWLRQLRESMANGPAFSVTAVEPAEDLTTFEVGGMTISGATFEDILAWNLDSELPGGVTYSERDDLLAAVGAKLVHHWLTLEAPVRVKLGDAAEQDFTIKIITYFGAESDSTPHKRAIRSSDVFLYNGHSYIGYGPLDPSRFSTSDFPASYQILFIDGCVSYNYYEHDYFPLKTGGSENLELITNGLEAPSWHSGYALGRFVNTMLFDGGASYQQLLEAAEDTDSLRVVDGELDNAYDPAATPLAVSW